jgi:two-component system, chemotaxis family, protein-glutamate methylesterase/glutaminase
MTRLRVLVADDSLTVRRRLCEVLAAHPDFDVVGEAADGKQAIEHCRRLRPDVITMDMMMPVMSGLSATEYIMAHCPTPILVVSASVNRGELFKTYDALAAGAVDVLDKPLGDETDGDWEQRFVASVKMAARIRVITHLRARLPARLAAAGNGAAGAHAGPVPVPVPGQAACRVIALGASTGGPGALVDVLGALPAPLCVPVLVVLHINDTFAGAFADWLDAQTPHRVAYARDGEPLAATTGRITVAPPGCHLVVAHGLLRLTHTPERHSCRPAVDCLFESLAGECGSSTAAALLTGMGRDGALGLLAIRQAGGQTLAQDEASSVVYGMPREAVALGAAGRVLPLAEIGPALTALAPPAWRDTRS